MCASKRSTIKLCRLGTGLQGHTSSLPVGICQSLQVLSAEPLTRSVEAEFESIVQTVPLCPENVPKRSPLWENHWPNVMSWILATGPGWQTHDVDDVVLGDTENQVPVRRVVFDPVTAALAS